MKKILIVGLIFAAYYWIKNRNNAPATAQKVDSTLKPSWLLTSSNLKASTPVNTGTTGSQTNSGTGSTSSDSSGSGEPPVAKGSGQFTVAPAFGLHSKSNSCFR